MTTYRQCNFHCHLNFDQNKYWFEIKIKIRIKIDVKLNRYNKIVVAFLNFPTISRNIILN
jgi:hypothetical protein